MIFLNALLTPDIGLMFWTVLIFLLLLLILRKLGRISRKYKKPFNIDTAFFFIYDVVNLGDLSC